MPRRERPLDSDGDVLSQFARGLRGLRRAAGSPTYRELARLAHYAAGTLSDAAGGRKLPTLAVTLAYVRACGGDVEAWKKTWHALAAELAGEPTGAEEREPAKDAPYVGLDAFQVEDAHRFFGRERVLDELDGRLARRRFVAVFGPSGTGKSSLLRAGLVARRTDAAVVLFRPGPHPFHECALRLAPLVGSTATQVLRELKAAPESLHLLLRQAGHGRTAVVVVDQFEELFTLCTDADERAAFFDALLAAPSSAAEVVIAVRADFLSRCAEHRELAEAVSESRMLLGAMTTAELREAIVKPAARAGLSVEGALVTELVAEAHAEPGVLPLLSHALLETWRKRRGTTLAVTGYHATGGIRGALAATAENEYTSLDEAGQAIAQQLFLRSVGFAAATGATKRRILRDELEPRVDAVLERLAAARLITLDVTTVELTHEALIDAWPRLRSWVAVNEADLRVQRQLTEAAAAWEETNREPDALARGTRLALARRWAAAMSPREREFLLASLEAERAEQRRDKRRRRQLRWHAVGLATLLLLTLAVAGDTRRSGRDVTEPPQIALSRQLAAEAGAIAGQDTGRAIRLSLESLSAADTVEARSSLFSIAGRPATDGLLPAQVPLALSSDGTRLASAEHDGIAIWDVPHRERTALLAAERTEVTAVDEVTHGAFDSGGRHLATVTRSERLALWDVRTGTRLAEAAVATNEIRGVAFSPDGSRIALLDSRQLVSLWDAKTLTLINRVPGESADDSMGALAFTPDGRSLLTTSGHDQAVLRDAATGVPVARFPGSAFGERPLAIDPTGTRLAIPDGPGQVKIWDAATRELVARLPDTGEVNGIAFLDRRTLLLAGVSRGITLWKVDQPQSVVLSDEGGSLVVAAGTVLAGGHTGTRVWNAANLPLLTGAPRKAMAFTDGDRSLLVAGPAPANGALVQKWRLTDRGHDDLLTNTRSQPPVDYAFTRDGSRLATLDFEQGLVIHEIAGGVPPVRLLEPRDLSGRATAFSPDGIRLAVGYRSAPGHIGVWELAGPYLAIDLPVRGQHLAYSPDRRRLAIDDGDKLLIWDLATRTAVTDVPHGPGPLKALAYSPDGTLLAIARGNATVEVWDVAQRRHVADLASSADLLTFSPNGRFLATGSGEKLVVWQVAGWARWADLTGTGSAIAGGAWSSDENTLATAALDGTLTLWPVSTGRATTQLCATLTRDFPANARPEPGVCHKS